jgi:hypothetical protein
MDIPKENLQPPTNTDIITGIEECIQRISLHNPGSPKIRDLENFRDALEDITGMHYEYDGTRKN